MPMASFLLEHYGDFRSIKPELITAHTRQFTSVLAAKIICGLVSNSGFVGRLILMTSAT